MNKPTSINADGVGTQLLPRRKLPYIYLSGRFDTTKELVEKEQRWLQRSGCKMRCWSYPFVALDGFYKRKFVNDVYHLSIEKKLHIMMDSGGFSLHEFLRKGKVADVERFAEETVKKYATFCLADRQHWDFYCNFDTRIHAGTVYAMQKRLTKLGLHPTPVFHGDDGLDWLRRYIDDGHKIIAVGSGRHLRHSWEAKRYYLDQVFNVTEKAGVLCHGLAFTSASLALCYPWYSIDSSTWAKAAAYGKIIIVDPEQSRMDLLHVSARHSDTPASYNRMSKRVQATVREQTERVGFEFGKLQTDLWERQTYNAWIYSHWAELGLQPGGKGKVNWGRLW